MTEHHVRRALDARAGRCTRIIVAHRLSSAARADRVAWLEDGRLRATGRHDALWRDPEYRALFSTDTDTADGGTGTGTADGDGGSAGSTATGPGGTSGPEDAPSSLTAAETR